MGVLGTKGQGIKEPTHFKQHIPFCMTCTHQRAKTERERERKMEREGDREKSVRELPAGVEVFSRASSCKIHGELIVSLVLVL